jgi:hypothetical protein
MEERTHGLDVFRLLKDDEIGYNNVYHLFWNNYNISKPDSRGN